MPWQTIKITAKVRPNCLTLFKRKSLHCLTELMNTSNPYRQQIIAQGRDPIDAPVLEVPARYRDRFKSYAEYQEAIAEMLNGM